MTPWDEAAVERAGTRWSWWHESGRREEPHAPVSWRRIRKGGCCTEWTYFSAYSFASIAKWVRKRGHIYQVRLRNGQCIVVKPKIARSVRAGRETAG